MTLHLRQTAAQSIAAAAALTLALGTIAPASAAGVEFGEYLPSKGVSAAAAALSATIVPIPVNGTGVDLTALAPLSGGDYAITAEARTNIPGGTALGIGAGAGRIGAQQGLVLDLLGRIPTPIPLVSVSLRFYANTANSGGTAGFAGLTLRF